MDVYKRLLILAKSQIPRFLLAAVCMAIVGGSTAAAAFLVKPALDDIFLNRKETSLYWIPAAVIIVYLVKGAANYGQHVLMNYIGNRIVPICAAYFIGTYRFSPSLFLQRTPQERSFPECSMMFQ